MTALGRPPVVAALGVLTLLLVVWAAAVPRPARVILGRREGVEVKQQAPAEGVQVFDPDVDAKRIPGHWDQTSDTVAFLLGWATIGILVLGALFCLYLLVRAFVRNREQRTPEVSAAADLDLEALASAVTMNASDRLAALSAGTPAEGIIAAWAHLEATLHEAGVALPASRTSSEVTVDVLRRFSVDPGTLSTLAALYREARWSQHALSEADRSRAAAAYRSLDDDVRAGMPQPSPSRRG